MSDMINRQEAIDALDRAAECWNIAEPFNEGMRAGYKAAVTIVLSLPSAQPEKRTNKSMETHACDCISRYEAIDAVKDRYYKYGRFAKVEELAWAIEALPSAQPERKKGEWIPVTNGRGGFECDQCHNYAPSYQDGVEWLSGFCPNCGADMREASND